MQGRGRWCVPQAYDRALCLRGTLDTITVMKNLSKNVKLDPHFHQVAVWEGTTLGDHKPEDMIAFISAETNGSRLQYLEQISTNPDPGDESADAGGRIDQFFAVHEDDVAKFAVPRLALGIRWLEDIFGNGRGHRYPDRVSEYQCWSK